MSTHEPSHAPAGIPLQALVAELRSRCEAVSRLQGGATYFHEELGIFRTYAEEHAPYVIEGNTAFYDPQRQIVISDTHRGNIILMDDGLLAPIDLRVQTLSAALIDTVAKLCSAPSVL